MNQVALEKWEKEAKEARDETSFKEYEYNIKNIHHKYADFDLDKGLPSTSTELGIDTSLDVKAFMAWRALVCSYYCTSITSDIINYSYIISYYDKYEIPTCYRTIKISFSDVSSIATGIVRNDFESNSKFFKRTLEHYLIKIGFMRVAKRSIWQRIIDIISRR